MDAVEKCHQLGQHLVSFDSDEEMLTVKTFVTRYANTIYTKEKVVDEERGKTDTTTFMYIGTWLCGVCCCCYLFDCWLVGFNLSYV